MTCLDGNNNLLCLSRIVVVEKQPAVNSLVRTFLFFHRACMDKTKCPPLKLILFRISQSLSTRKIDRFTYDLVLRLVTKSVFEPMFHQGDCKVSDVYAYPFSIKFLSYIDRGSATAKWIKNRITFIAACLNNSFQ